MHRSSIRAFTATALFLTLAISSAGNALLAQAIQRPVTHDDYDRWPSIRGTAVSHDGAWLAYVVKPSRGDGELIVRQSAGDTEHRYALGTGPKFSKDGRYVVFRIEKSYLEERRKKLDKLHGGKSKEVEAEAKREAKAETERSEQRRERMMARFRRGLPMNGGGGDDEDDGEASIGVLDLQSGDVEVIANVKRFSVTRDAEHLVYQLGEPKKPKKAEGEKKSEAGEKKASKEAEEKAAEAEPEAREATARGEGRGRRRRGARGARGRRGAAAARSARSGKPTAKKPEKGGTPLIVREFASGAEQRFEGVTRYDMLARDRWLTIASKHRAAEPEADKTKKAEEGEKKVARLITEESAAEEAAAEEGATEEAAAPAVTGTVLADGLYAHEFASGRQVQVLAGAGSYSGFTSDPHFAHVAFSSDVRDQLARAAEKKRKEEAAEAAKAKEGEEAEGGESKSEEKKAASKKDDAKEDKKDPRRDIYLWSFADAPAQRVIDAETAGLPEGAVVQSSGLSFSDDASTLVFGIKDPKPADLPKILPEDKVVVDIWHWNEGAIQPLQAKQARRQKNPTKTCVWHVDDRRVTVLGDKAIPSARMLTRDGSRALMSDSKPYEKLATWDSSYNDLYLVNTIDGSRKKIVEKLRSRPRPSPAGKWILMFGLDNHWHAMNVATQETRCLTEGLGVAFQNELEDRPQPASGYGIAGWTEGDEHVLLYDRYDIWKVALNGDGGAECMTDGYGRANQTVLRVSRFDLEGDDDDIDPIRREYLPETVMLTARDDQTKAMGYFTDSTVGVGRPKRLMMMNESIGGLRRAKGADRLFFTRSTFRRFPDIWTAQMDFADMKQLTDACPIQRERRWGDAELVSWINDDGVAMKGILAKPDGFDPEKKYPMMVYFYERNADGVNRYRAPTPGTSPNQSYYVSNGYLWFVPDIIYTEGYPGESAEKCVISGVQHLIAQGFVDRDAIGCAGHSWGGYQTAHLVTRSNLFAAAESGAPVSNMFSAYGGIRYDSGRSRQFQYERTQSRIGGTPWTHPQRYWQNSPLFYADRVQTPVLLLHNDKDGAVPWTNGIEFFMALRRLGKEAYLFNYNGEPHGLRKRQNQKDWSRRMAQFFDHHLRGAPAPEWMTEGVPYLEREREKIRFAPSFIEASESGAIEPAAVEAVVGGNDKRD